MSKIKAAFSLGKNGKYILSILLVCFLFSTSFYLMTSFNFPSKVEFKDNSMICTFNFEEPVLEEVEINGRVFTRIHVENCTSSGRIGSPALPSYPAHILIPHGSKIKNIKVTAEESVKLDYDFRTKPVIPQQEFFPYSCMPEQTEFKQNKTVYNSSKLVLNKCFQKGDIGFCRGFKILQVSLYPVDQKPGEGETFFYPEIVVTVEFEKYKSFSKEKNQFLRLKNNDIDIVKAFVSNPDQIETYTQFDDNQYNNLDSGSKDYTPFEYSNGLCDPADTYEYVIITNNALKNDNTETYNWTDLINHRQTNNGLNGIVVSVEDITACTDYWNTSDETFNDTQAHIREFCKDAYQDWSTEYLILGGNWYLSNQIVPYRLFTDRHNTKTYDTMACDRYYSHLDGTWYYATDDIWGGGKGSGVNDYYGELYVGRITAYNASMVSNAVNKIINYDNNNSLNDDWISKASFWGGDLSPNSATSKDYMEELRLGTDTHRTFTGFEEWNNANPDDQINTTERIYHEDEESGYETLFSNSVENNNFSILNHLDHSSWTSPFSLGNWDTRYNTKPFFGYSQGCLAGRFHSGYSACEQMLCRHTERHAYAIVVNTGYGWGSKGSTDGPAQYMQAYFWDYFFTNQSENQNNWELGKAFLYASDEIASIVSTSNQVYCYQWYSTHLFGDPAQVFRINGNNDPPEVSSENPADQATDIAINTTSLSATIQDPEGDSFSWSIETSPNVGTNSGNNENNGSKSCSVSNLEYNTTYTWYVNTTDGNLSNNETFQFTTEIQQINNPPVHSSPSPANNSEDVSISLNTISININDPEGDSFNWTIETSPNIGSNNSNNDNNGTKTTSISTPLSFDTIYTWYVNTTDSASNNWTNNSYVFTSRSQYTADAPGSFTATADNRTQITLTWNDDTEADATLIEWHTEADPTWNPSDHNTLYNGTAETTTHNGLNPDTTRHYKTWSYNNTDHTWSNGATDSATTDANNLPSLSSQNPNDDSGNVDINETTVSVSITDSDSDNFDWTIQGNNLVNSEGSGETDGVKTANLQTPLSFNSNIIWYVNVTDGFGWSNSSYNFTTREEYNSDAPSSFTATGFNRTQITLTWNDDSEADSTFVERHTSSDGGWNRGDHVEIYNGTLESCTDTDLNPATTYYYKAWSYNSTDNTWSSGSTDDGTTTSNNPPSQNNENPSDNSGNIETSQVSVSIDIEDSESDSFNWTIEGKYITNTGANDETNGTKNANLITPLPYNTNIIWYVNATDGYNWNNQTYNFTTREEYNSDAPSSFTATADNRTQITLTWNDDTEADTTLIEWHTEADPTWNPSDHNTLYNGTAETTTHNGLNPNTTRHYKTWSYNNTDHTWSNGATDSATTDSNNPPNIQTPSPNNESTNQDLSFTWSISIEDTDGDNFNYTIESSNNQNTNENNAEDGSKNLALSNLEYSTSYKVWVNATDGYDWSRKWYTFTTMDPPPNNSAELSSPSPSNNSGSVSNSKNSLSITITDPEGDSFNWTIELSNGDTNSGNNENNGSKTCSISSLSYSTEYTWTVNVIDSGSNNWTNATYTFTTQSNPGGGTTPDDPPPPSNNAPVANAGGPYTAETGQTITMNGSESYDSDGDTLTYNWEFGDGETATTVTTTHSYSNPGNYTINLTVSDGTDTDTDSTTATITTPANNQAPTAKTNGPYTALTNQSITLDGSQSSDSDGTIVNYTWDIGNTDKKYRKTTNYVYQSEGIYNVTLTVTDNNGSKDSTTTTATISLDSDEDGWSDEDETNYGTNASDPDDKPEETNEQNTTGNQTTNETNIADEDNDGISDQIEEQIGTDSKNTTSSEKIQLNQKEHLIIDTDNDGEYDIFYNSENKNFSKMKKQKNVYLIDEDGDGTWDYTYDPSNGAITAIKTKKTNTEKQTFTIIYALIAIVLSIIILTIFLSYKFKKKPRKTKKETEGKTKIPSYFKQEIDRPYQIKKQQNNKQQIKKPNSKNKPENKDRDYFESGATKTKKGFIKKLLNDVKSERYEEPEINPLETDMLTTVKYSKINPMERFERITQITKIENEYETHIDEIEEKIDDLIVENIHKKIDEM